MSILYALNEGRSVRICNKKNIYVEKVNMLNAEE